MNNKVFSSVNRIRNELFLISLCIILFLAHAALPLLKYPFLILYSIITIYILVNHRDKIFSGITDLKRFFPLVLVLFLYLLITAFLGEKMYLMLFKDIVNIFILLSLILFLNIFVNNSDNLRSFYNLFLKLVILIAVIISLQRIYSYFYATTYKEIFYDQYIFKNRAVVDKNFAQIPVLFGFIAILYGFLQKKSKSEVLTYNFLLFIFSVNFLLSGSKRGIFLFLSLLAVLFIIQVWNLKCNNLKIRQLSIYSKYYIISISLSFILLVLFFLKTSVYFKNSVLDSIGIKNISFTKTEISETIFRYVHFLDKDLSWNKIYSKIWQPVFDPKDPEAWYGNGNYKIAGSINGKNSRIVPAGSKGYLFDNSCLGLNSPTHSYYFITLKQESVKTGDSLIASIYCYVSDNFDGDGAAIRAEGSLTGNPDKFYDLKNKGCWQQLILPINCLQGDIIIYLYMNKGGVADFSNLRGYVIFAYPELKIVPSVKSVSDSSSTSNYLHNKLIENSVVDMSELSVTHSSPSFNNIIKSTFFDFSIGNIIVQINTPIDRDPIRRWIAKLVSEDTTYHGYNANLFVKKSMDNFGEDRIARWKFALEIFTKEYGWSQKIFGGGFSFLNWYGYYFYNDKTRSDYPHNPFLSVLLYSGIIGLILYLILMYKVFYYYIRYFNEYKILFIFFIITFFFSFFSAGNPFDPPIMGFFVMLPFFIHSIHKKEKNITKELKAEE